MASMPLTSALAMPRSLSHLAELVTVGLDLALVARVTGGRESKSLSRQAGGQRVAAVTRELMSASSVGGVRWSRAQRRRCELGREPV